LFLTAISPQTAFDEELAAGIDESTAAVAGNPPGVPPIMASHVLVKDDLI
jgi:hypothetical protein